MTSTAMLVLALLGLLIGPVLHVLWPTVRPWRWCLDGFSLALVGGLCLLYLLPHIIDHGGGLALAVVCAAAVLPGLVHRHGRGESRTWTIMLFGLFWVHASVDGMALSALEGGDGALGFALAAHRLPVGLTVFVTGQAFSARGGWTAIALLCLSTVLGFGAGNAISMASLGGVEALLEAAVVGVLLHIIFDHHSLDEHSAPHDHHHSHSHHHHHDDLDASNAMVAQWWSGVGAIAGLVLVGIMLYAGIDTAEHHAVEVALHVIERLGFLGTGMWLFGTVLAASVPLLLAHSGRLSTLRSLVVVSPCDVLPAYATRWHARLHPAMALGMLLMAPVLGLDTILLAWVLLGARMTAFWLVCALLTATLVAILVGGRLSAPERAPDQVIEHVPEMSTVHRTWLARMDHTLPWGVAGVLAAALVACMLTSNPNLPWWAVACGLSVLTVPTSVLTLGMLPIAAVVLWHGMPPAMVLTVLLVTLGTSHAHVALLSRLHSRSTAWSVVAVVGVAAALCGWMAHATGILSGDYTPSVPSVSSVWHWIAVLVLAVMVVRSVLQQGPRGFMDQLLAPDAHH